MGNGREARSFHTIWCCKAELCISMTYEILTLPARPLPRPVRTQVGGGRTPRRGQGLKNTVELIRLF